MSQTSGDLVISKCEAARQKVCDFVMANGKPELVAGFDWTLLIDLFMGKLMDWLSNCLGKDSAQAVATAKDGFWYNYFAKKAAKEAVREKYGDKKKDERDDAAGLLLSAAAQINPNDRAGVIDELKGKEDLAGLLI